MKSDPPLDRIKHDFRFHSYLFLADVQHASATYDIYLYQFGFFYFFSRVFFHSRVTADFPVTTDLIMRAPWPLLMVNSQKLFSDILLKASGKRTKKQQGGSTALSVSNVGYICSRQRPRPLVLRVETLTETASPGCALLLV